MAKKVGATKKKEVFSILAPQAQNVTLVGNFSGWEAEPIPLTKQKDGSWKTTVPLQLGSYEYRFLVDGRWTDDPQCETHVPNPFGASNCLRTVG